MIQLECYVMRTPGNQYTGSEIMLPCSERDVPCCSLECTDVVTVSFGNGRFFTAEYSSRILHWILSLSLAE
jgi:hypothetical protein